MRDWKLEYLANDRGGGGGPHWGGGGGSGGIFCFNPKKIKNFFTKILLLVVGFAKK